MTALPSPDDYSEVLVRDILAAIPGVSEGQVRAVCAGLSGSGMTDKGIQWKLCQEWGLAWEELEAIRSLGARNVEAIAKGVGQRGLAIAGVTQRMLMEKLGAGTPDINELKAYSTICKQQVDVFNALTKDTPASQHVHFHGGENIELLRMLREQKANERPAAERCRETLRAAGHEV